MLPTRIEDGDRTSCDEFRSEDAQHTPDAAKRGREEGN